VVEAVTRTEKDLRHEIARVATRMLTGEVGLHEGCHEIARLRTGLSEPEVADPDLLVFVGVDSELDDVPLGDVRQRWAPEALAVKDAQTAEYLGRARDGILRACQAVVAQWGPSA
jgi:hypothetical protein